jgi:hypothetical protein
MSTGFHSVAHAVTGSHADNLRHAAVRVGFLNALVADPRVQYLFAQWTATMGEAVQGLDDDDDTDDAAVLDAVANALAKALERFSPSTFVFRMLKLDWSWVAYELVDTFLRRLLAGAGLPFVTRVYDAVIEAPQDLEIVFRSRAGESVAEARARWHLLTQEIMATLDARDRQQLGGRPQPKRDRQFLQDWGAWYYAARVKEPPESVSAIAKGHHAGAGHAGAAFNCCRTHVGAKIREAQALLELSPYRIDPAKL